MIKLSATTLNPLKGEVRLSIHVDVITCNTHLKPLSCRPRGQLVTRQQPKVARGKMCIPSLVSEWLLGEVGCKEISPADCHDHPKGQR